MSSFPGDNEPKLLRQWEVRNFEGVMLTLVESLGLPEKQESAVKGIVTKELWNWAGFLPRLVEIEPKIAGPVQIPTVNFADVRFRFELPEEREGVASSQVGPRPRNRRR